MNKPSDEQIIEAMSKYGGGFVKQLTVLWKYADKNNKLIIKQAFNRYWNDYKKFTRISINWKIR